MSLRNGASGAEARREVEVRAGLARDPVALGDAIAVEPENEAALDGLLRRRLRRHRPCRGVEHAHQRRQADLDGAAGERQPLKKSPARHTEALSDYLRHFAPPCPGNSRARIIEIIISLNLKPDFRKSSKTRADHRPVGGRFGAPGHVPEILLHDALLALRTGGQHRAEFLGRRESGIRNPGDLARGVEVQFDRRDLRAAPRLPSPKRLAEGELELVAPLPDGIELLEAEADRVDQGVAAGAGLAWWRASPCGRGWSSAWLR